MNSIKTLGWNNGCLTLLNQTKLPISVEFIECSDWRIVAEAIRRLEVRGAPAIGAAAAFGLVLGAQELVNQDDDFWPELLCVAEQLKETRPTAINLFWAVDRMMSVASRFGSGSNPSDIAKALEQEAIAIAHEDQDVNKRISEYGASLFT